MYKRQHVGCDISHQNRRQFPNEGKALTCLALKPRRALGGCSIANKSLGSDVEKECFDLLKKAYIDARYKKEYKITKKQLEYLAKRVKLLQRLTKKICQQKIDSFV